MEEIQQNYTPAPPHDLDALRDAVARVKDEVRKIIVGQDSMIDLLITAILSNGHVLIEGVPGVAKTLSAKIIARCISADFSRIQFTPDLMPSDILGTNIFNFKSSEFEFRRGPIFSNIILIDEINRAPAKTQAALFEVMEERQVTIDSTTHMMSEPFIVFATQNPIEHEGTYRLPEAQLDRFIYKIEVGYPTLEQEVRILTDFQERGGMNDLKKINAVLTAAELKKYQIEVRKVYIEAKLVEFIARIIARTRDNPDLYVGASPRASLALLSASKAMAAIRGRNFVTPDDIIFASKPVLRHRIVLTPEKEMEGVSANQVIENFMKNIEIPR
ncbi:MAG: MoxR family ATPase [Bacteroidetes bacterium]|nr:MoxR family ATPase [Bacteroidota bacterium]